MTTSELAGDPDRPKMAIPAGQDMVLRIPEASHLRVRALQGGGVEVTLFTKDEYAALLESGGDPFSDG